MKLYHYQAILTSLFSLFVMSLALSPTNYIENADKERFIQVLNNAGQDVKSQALSIVGYSLIEKKYNKETEACNNFKSIGSSKSILNDYYYAALGASHLSNCLLSSNEINKYLPAISETKSTEELYKLVMVKKMLKVTVEKDVEKHLETLLKKEGGIALSQSYSYQIMTELNEQASKLEKYFLEIDDTIQQADESDGIFLYYDNQLEGTAFILNSIMKLSDKFGKAPTISNDKIVKFANFLLSRRYTIKLSSAVEVFKALKSLARNKYAVPIVVKAINNGLIRPDESDKVQFSLNNLWGDPITNVKVTAESVEHITDKNRILSNRALTPSENLPGVYILDIRVNGNKPPIGFYNIKLSLDSSDNRFAKGITSEVTVKMTTELSIINSEIFIKEKDQMHLSSLHYKLTMGSQLNEKISLNWHHKLELLFGIVDRSTNKAIIPHQVFVKMRHLVTNQEIIFVVEADKTTDGKYRFVLDLEKSGKDFDNISGDYEMQMIVGDVSCASPIQWTINSLRLDMPGTPAQPKDAQLSDEAVSRRSVAGSKRNMPSPRVGSRILPSQKKLISHMFRPAEKRGGQLISTVFTVLCIVPPVLIMLILWFSMGVNVSNFPFSISSILFHVGLISIFGLYYCYWKYLNMFVTLRYLLLLGVLTAFFGNRVLRVIAAANTQKQKAQ